MFLAFLEKLPAAPCLFLHNATCEAAMNYTKKKNVFRLHLKDGIYLNILYIVPTKHSLLLEY
jgi:hypothetical protein